jgi:hypothetical protein
VKAARTTAVASGRGAAFKARVASAACKGDKTPVVWRRHTPSKPEASARDMRGLPSERQFNVDRRRKATFADEGQAGRR